MVNEKRFTYTTRLITDKKAYYKYYILDNETLLCTEQIVAILNAQNDYIDYVTKERNIAYNKLENYKEKILELQKENIELKKLKKYCAEWMGIKEENLSLRCGEMSEKQLKEEKLDCKKKYLYEYSMFWECNDGCKCQILEDDVVDLLNEQQDIIQQKDNQIKQLNLAIDDLLTYTSCDEIKKQNEILRKKYLKIPKGIRDVWKE